MRSSENWIDEGLSGLRAQDLFREIAAYPGAGGKVLVDGRSLLNFSSNDYLDLAGNPGLKTAAEKYLSEFGTGSTASRLVTGTLTCHTELEKRLAALKGYPRALVFGSGYLANAGIIPAIAGRGDHVFVDKFVHASIVDGAIISRAGIHRFNHNDSEHLNELLGKAPATGRRVVITESVFSMDGDLAPLREIVDVVEKHGAMTMVDEAHATGVFGPGGSGLVHELGLEGIVNLSMGTLSKALGGYGGFVACSASMQDWLVNRARTFIYSTALPPAVIGAAIGALDLITSDPDAGARLLDNAAFFRSILKTGGLNIGDSSSQIVPVIVGEAGRAVALSKKLKEKGIVAIAIRPPTVPAGTARLRFSITLAHTREDLRKAAGILLNCMR